MGKVQSSASHPIRKAPPSGRTAQRSSGRDIPAHDPIPVKMGTGTPRDKAWCKKCTAWRYFRGIRRIITESGQKAFQGKCVTCGTAHTFLPRGR